MSELITTNPPDPDAKPSQEVIIPLDATSKARTPPVGPVAHRPGANILKEYVSGEPRLFVSRFVKALPVYIDDITRDFGSDLYDRMTYDAQIYSCVNVLKKSVLSEKGRVVPAIKDQKHPRYQRAKEFADFCEANLEHLDRPYDAFLFEMLDGMPLGHKVAEQIHEIKVGGKYNGLLMLKTLKVKPRATTAFVVDAYWNVIGLLGLIPGQGAPVLVGHIVADPSHLSNLLPRDKFVIFTFNPANNDPRGRSILRPAYNPWWLKQQAWAMYLEYLTKFSSPSVWGTTPENASVQKPSDGLGNPTGAASQTPEEAMLVQLQNLRAGAAGAFPFGTTVNLLQVAGAGEPFINFITLCDKQISKAILDQTLATEEAEHMARAASDTHQDIFDIGVRHGRNSVGMMTRHDIFRPLCMWNFPDPDVEELIPYYERAAVSQPDWDRYAGAVATLVQSGFIDESQKTALDEKLGLPARENQNQEVALANDGNPAINVAEQLTRFDPVEVHKGMEIETPKATSPTEAILAVVKNLTADPAYYSKITLQMQQQQQAAALPEQGPQGHKNLTPGPPDNRDKALQMSRGGVTSFSTPLPVGQGELEEAASALERFFA